MTAAEAKEVKSETVTIGVSVIAVANELKLAMTVGEQTTALDFLDALRLSIAITKGCEELKKLLDAKSAKAILQ
jgi:hypothetical protein